MPRKPAWFSRKFWIATITALVMLISTLTGVELDIEEILAIVLPVIAYVLGESYIDARK